MIVNAPIASAPIDTTDGGTRTEISALLSENQSGWTSQPKRKRMVTLKLT